MQISQMNQSILYEDDLYDLDIELKITGLSINTHENADLESTRWQCSPTCGTMYCG
ncbi:MAG: hypothetical protein ACRCU0_01710 [Candidatus Rhabdochlamydia sp.]